ncbi:MAG: c-type cytochrome biogenesis protein CcmI [Nevskia sp.]|jgi:cytochrome c-type biogenesis protein CcmH|uniref:c-type cytochrome biogenesis protein CcmI n=1 Tax=Nevskia sp. TaxID=1929292 RepID=UPI004035D77A
MNATLLTGLAMAGLLLLAVLLATHPWWRSRGGSRQNRRAANVAAYRLRVAEIDNETAAGLIPADEAAALRAELDARVLTDADGTEPELAQKIERRPGAIVLVALLLTMFASGWYLWRGGWETQQQIAAGPPPASAIDPAIAAMVDKLATRLKANPDDAEGWSMLGRSYMVTQRFAEAAAAMAEANKRAAAPRADWLADEGEALAFAGGEDVSGPAAERFEEALKLDPAYPKALWYGGLGAVGAGDYATGRARWQQLIDQPDLDENMRTVLRERVAALDKALAERGLSAAEAPAAGPAAAAPAAAVSLRVQVALAPALAGKVPAGAILFVFAKAASGPPMPLAVQRLADARLPLTVTLDDSMAMAPGLKLSAFEQYVITARLSAGGSVQAQAGDLEGRAEARRATASEAPVSVIIDTVVP